VNTATPTRDQAVMRQTVDRLTEVIAQLGQIADDMTDLANDAGTDIQGAQQIWKFARSAADTTDLALMIADNELKLAERAGSAA